MEDHAWPCINGDIGDALTWAMQGVPEPEPQEAHPQCSGQVCIGMAGQEPVGGLVVDE